MLQCCSVTLPLRITPNVSSLAEINLDMEISVAWRQFAQRMGVECLVWESCASAVLGGVDRSGSEIAALLLHPAVSCQPQPTPSRTLTGPNTHQPRHLASVLCPHLCFSPPVMCEMSAVCSLHAACLLQERGMLGGDGPWVVTVPNQYRCLTGASSPPRPLPGLSPASPQHLPGLHDEDGHSPCL